MTTQSLRYPSLATSTPRKPQAQWMKTGRLIDSMRQDLLEAEETTTRRPGPTAVTTVQRAPRSVRALPAAPAVEEEDYTDEMKDLPFMTEAGEPAQSDDRPSSPAASRASRILCVTAPESAKMRIARAQPPAAPPAMTVRAGVLARASLSAIDTQLLTLSPALLAALKHVAPKQRRSKLVYVVAVAMAAIVGALAADASMRDFVAEKAQGAAAFVQQ